MSVNSPLWISIGTAVLMGGLVVEAYILRSVHDDRSSIYKLFALRDKLIRLVIDGKIERHEAHFEALYRNVNIILRGSRRIEGPGNYDRAKRQGINLARHPARAAKLTALPSEQLPDSLGPIVRELREALKYLIDNHGGVMVQMDSRRRAAATNQKQQAEALLEMMPQYSA